MVTPAESRPTARVPWPVLLVLLIALLAQLLWATNRPDPVAHAEDLPPAPPVQALRLLGVGDAPVLSRGLSLWLQAFDNQPGVSIPFSELDYEVLAGWLDVILLLDQNNRYPLLAASRIYATVPDPRRQAIMLDFVAQKFLEFPNARWQWLAHAIYVARHRMDDPDRALVYARLLAKHATGDNVPFWAQQMHIYTLEQMGEVEAAMILLGGLIESGEITDPQELRFLEDRLRVMQRP